MKENHKTSRLWPWIQNVAILSARQNPWLTRSSIGFHHGRRRLTEVFHWTTQRDTNCSQLLTASIKKLVRDGGQLSGQIGIARWIVMRWHVLAWCAGCSSVAFPPSGASAGHFLAPLSRGRSSNVPQRYARNFRRLVFWQSAKSRGVKTRVLAACPEHTAQVLRLVTEPIKQRE